MPRQPKTERGTETGKALSPRAQTYIQETRATTILDLFVQGNSVAQMAQKLGVTEEAVTTAITNERRKMSLHRQEMMESHLDISNAQIDWLISKVFPVIEYQASTAPETGPSEKLVKLAMELIKLRKEILTPPKDGNKPPEGQHLTQINNTFVANSPLYDEALKQMQTDFSGFYVHKPEEGLLIEPDERLVKLQELASPYFDTGELYNAIDSEPDTD